MKKIIILGLISGLLVLIGCSSDSPTTNAVDDIKLFKSASCGCCVGYTSVLDGEGYEVDAVNVQDMSSVKRQFDIPRNMQSCHTAVVGDYFVEGHVPMEAVQKLLEEKPDIDGIALPNMPSGSPGMPGPKRGQWQIYAIKDGKASPFMTV